MRFWDEDRSVYSGHFEVEILIDGAVDEVWKQLLDFGSWLTTHRVEQLSGAHEEVGGIKRISPKLESLDVPPVPPPHYHFGRLIQLVPQQQYLMKAYSAPGGSYGVQIRAFEDIRLATVDAKTKVVFNGYIEYSGEVIAKSPGVFTVDISRQAMTTNLMNLKRIVERGSLRC